MYYFYSPISGKVNIAPGPPQTVANTIQNRRIETTQKTERHKNNASK